jgi:hypothetical protein
LGESCLFGVAHLHPAEAQEAAFFEASATLAAMPLSQALKAGASAGALASRIAEA